MTPEQQTKVVVAAEAIANEAYEAFGDNAKSFSCHEIELIADLYRALDQDPSELIDLHARGDEEGDAHWDPALERDDEDES